MIIKERNNISGSGHANLFHFNSFELDVTCGELRFGHRRLMLQPQPFKVLALLVSKSGQIVTRDEIKEEVWDSGIFVDFSAGLNFCVRQIRRVLGEDARRPRFIETVHRRGYRFMAPVKTIIENDSKDTSPNASDPIIGEDVAKPTTVAVLPFHDLSFPCNDTPLAAGITELLITYLATNSMLRVVSRTTTMQYKCPSKPLARIGHEVCADRVMEGAVLQCGMRVRVTARLINTLTDRSEWAACYDAEINDRLLLQEHIACAVASDALLYLAPKLKDKHAWTPRNIVAGASSSKSPGRVWPISPGSFGPKHEATIISRDRLT